MDAEPDATTDAPGRRFPGWLLTILPVGIFFLALNPWFSPQQHDDVLYFFGAKSIVETGEFALDGTPITDWPPLLSVFLAGARLVAGDSVMVAKLLIIAFVALGVFSIRAVAESHHFKHPTAVTAISCLLPISLISGANIMSEWPFLALSFLFILALQQLDSRRSWPWVTAAGLLLASAALTRLAGVFLGVAILAQMWRRFRSPAPMPVRLRLFSVVPELGVAAIGAIPWVMWKLRCNAAIASGDAPPGAYDQAGHYLERFSNIEPWQLFSKIEMTLLSLVKAVETRIDSAAVSAVVVTLFAAFLVAGMILQFRNHGIKPADWYIIAMLLVLLGDLIKPERYFLPIAPFLIGYLLVSVRQLATWFARGRREVWMRCLLGSWIAWLLMLDSYLLFVGNSDGSRGGFSMLASRDIESFYRKHHLDLYRVIRFIDEQAEAGAKIGAAGVDGKYVIAYSGRGYANLPGDDPKSVTWLIVRKGTELEQGYLDAGRWQVFDEFEHHWIYHRDTP